VARHEVLAGRLWWCLERKIPMELKSLSRIASRVKNLRPTVKRHVALGVTLGRI
jgi:hypothetical protein